MEEKVNINNINSKEELTNLLLKKSNKIIKFIKYEDSQNKQYLCCVFKNVFYINLFNDYVRNNYCEYKEFRGSNYNLNIYKSVKQIKFHPDAFLFRHFNTINARINLLVDLLLDYQFSIAKSTSNNFYYALFPVEERLDSLNIGNFNDDKLKIIQLTDLLDIFDEEIEDRRLLCMLSLTFYEIIVVNSLKDFLDSLTTATAYNMEIILKDILDKNKINIKNFDEAFVTENVEMQDFYNAFKNKLLPSYLLMKRKNKLFQSKMKFFKNIYQDMINPGDIAINDTIKSVNDAVKEIDEDIKKSIVGQGIWKREKLSPFYRNRTIFYRGVTSPIYPEMPKIFRSGDIYYKEEADSYREFSLYFADESVKRSPLDNLTTMQHYYLPTRLLDITTNPLVALYMACTKEFSKNDSEKDDCPGEIIYYFPTYHDKESELKYYDSDRVTVLSTLSLLEYSEKNTLLDFLIEHIDEKASIIKYFKDPNNIAKISKKYCSDSNAKKSKEIFYKLGRLVQKYYPAFDISIFNPFDLLKSYYVKVGYINERIAAQSGSFIIFGLDKNYAVKNLTNSRNINGIKRIIIGNKQNILAQLAALNVSQKTLMPDKEHVAKEITKITEM